MQRRDLSSCARAYKYEISRCFGCTIRLIYLAEDEGVEDNGVVVSLCMPHISIVLCLALVVKLHKLFSASTVTLSWRAEIGFVASCPCDGAEPGTHFVEPSKCTDRFLTCRGTYPLRQGKS